MEYLGPPMGGGDGWSPQVKLIRLLRSISALKAILRWDEVH